MDSLSMSFERSMQMVRESEHRVSELANALLLGNSFLVAGFAVILGQPIDRIVPYIIAIVGLLLCILLLLGINSAWQVYRVRVNQVYRIMQELKDSDKSDYRFIYTEEIPWFLRWSLPRLFGPHFIYRLWLPFLFLTMWILLIVFAL